MTEKQADKQLTAQENAAESTALQALSVRLDTLLAYPDIVDTPIIMAPKDRLETFLQASHERAPQHSVKELRAHMMKVFGAPKAEDLADVASNRAFCWFTQPLPDSPVLNLRMCAAFPDVREGTLADFLIDSVHNGAVGALATPVLNSLDAQAFTHIHERYHALRRLRLERETGAVDLKTIKADSTGVVASNTYMADEAGADVFWAEIGYRMTPPAERAAFLEKVRDMQAMRVLAFHGVQENKFDGRVMETHFTAPALGAWLDEAATRDATYTDWSTRTQLTPSELESAEVYATGVAAGALKEWDVPRIKREADVAETFRVLAFGAIAPANTPAAERDAYRESREARALREATEYSLDPLYQDAGNRLHQAVTRLTHVLRVYDPEFATLLGHYSDMTRERPIYTSAGAAYINETLGRPVVN